MNEWLFGGSGRCLPSAADEGWHSFTAQWLSTVCQFHRVSTTFSLCRLFCGETEKLVVVGVVLHKKV